MELTALVASVQRRLWLREILAAMAAGLVAVAGTTIVGPIAGLMPAVAMGAGIVAALIVTAASVRRARSRWTLDATATHIEAAIGGLDNLLVTATALTAGTLQASDAMRSEVVRQAEAQAAAAPVATVAPLWSAAALTLSALVGASLAIWSAMERPGVGFVATPDGVQGRGILDVRVTISPPAYLGRTPAVLSNPERLPVPAGSRVQVDLHAAPPEAWLVEPGQPVRSFTAASPEGFIVEWTPAASSAVVLAVGDRVGESVDTRVLNIMVEPDAAPHVRIGRPGRDLAVSDPGQVVEVAIEASDGEALRGLRLAYVKMSGSGESFAFAEGVVAVSIDEASEREWHGRARLALGSMQLEDGDALVYRALARDSNPEADWVESETYTIDVGRRFEFAASGSAIPDEDRRYALSQQMVIVKTERLQGDRTQLAADAWAEQTRLLAMEQRMVRAEVVFLSGGEVEDEVAEAEQSSELQEGRLQNAGRSEMMLAINEMSRAEARLNAGDTAGALAFERAALAALQRAFDRRRYFLRTLGERSRIDPSRRLTGNSASARSSSRSAHDQSAPGREVSRQLMSALARVSRSGEPLDAAALGTLATIEMGSDQWRQLAASLAAALTPEARREAAQGAMARLAQHAWARSGASAPVPASGELQGWWREESRSGGRR